MSDISETTETIPFDPIDRLREMFGIDSRDPQQVFEQLDRYDYSNQRTISRLDHEVERLRAHVRSLHRLNGYSKQKGWWCSCGAWRADMPYMRGEIPPWDQREQAVAQHAEHVQNSLSGFPSSTSDDAPVAHRSEQGDI